MKPVLALLFLVLACSCETEDNPTDCYTCKTEFTSERPNQPIETTTTTQDVCGETGKDEYIRKNTFEKKETTAGLEQNVKSKATCTKKP